MSPSPCYRYKGPLYVDLDYENQWHERDLLVDSVTLLIDGWVELSFDEGKWFRIEKPLSLKMRPKYENDRIKAF